MIVVDCQSGYSCHQQDKHVLGGCLCNQGQAAFSKHSQQVSLFGWVEGGTDIKILCAVK